MAGDTMASSSDRLTPLQRALQERVPQTSGAKHLIGSIAVDPIEEIFVNKLNTLLSRAEERDLVDLLFLERHGLRMEDGLRAALEKDGGCTPAALA